MDRTEIRKTAVERLALVDLKGRRNIDLGIFGSRVCHCGLFQEHSPYIKCCS